MPKHHQLHGTGMRGVLLISALTALAATATSAGAVSLRVRMACASDYFANCSMYRPDTPEVRKCMNAAGPRLSTRCVDALIAAGEVSGREVARRRARRHYANRD